MTKAETAPGSGPGPAGDAAANLLHESERTARDVTERKATEEALRASEARYRAILDSQPEFVVRYQPGGIISFVNDTLCRHAGLKRENLLGKSFYPFIRSDDRDDFIRKIERLSRNEPVMVAEARMVLPDGREAWHQCTHNAIFDECGALVEYQCTGRDISERKQAEEELRKSERLLQAIFDAEPECVKVLDENANLLLMNRAGLDMLEVDSLDEVKGQCVCPLVTSEYRQQFLDFTKQVFRGESGTILFEMVGMKGRRLWLETHAVPLRDEKGETTAMLGVTRDVTEAKRTEEALRSSEARFRTIIESATVGIMVVDIASEAFLYANPEICRLLGYTEAELLALTVTDLVPQEERAEAAADYGAHADGKRRISERTFQRKDGSAVRLSINSVPMELDGRSCLVGFFVDLTQKRLLEEERLKAQKLESIGTLAGGIAHDFNNLLQGVFGFISLAKLTIGQREKSLAMLEQAEKALHQAVGLTSQLLTFSKGGKPVRKMVDLRPTIENAVKFALSGSQVACKLSLSEDLWAVEADEGQIGQVIQNIVLNAEQAMPLGGCVEISARNVPSSPATGLPRPAADGLVEISVRDQGLGIPPERLQRVFDPYFTTKERGSGLGLATSYSIVKNHDGVISVQSEPGKGSTFTVLLPASRATPERTAVLAGRPAPWSGRVLVMDDEIVVRTVAGELLSAMGHEAAFAEDGAAAIACYTAAKSAGKPFDIVILDLTIRGGMGGAEAAQKLLEIDPAARVVVSSGYSDSKVVATYRQHGFRAFLNKPYNLEALSRALDIARAPR